MLSLGCVSLTQWFVVKAPGMQVLLSITLSFAGIDADDTTILGRWDTLLNFSVPSVWALNLIFR